MVAMFRKKSVVGLGVRWNKDTIIDLKRVKQKQARFVCAIYEGIVNMVAIVYKNSNCQLNNIHYRRIPRAGGATPRPRRARNNKRRSEFRFLIETVECTEDVPFAGEQE